MQIFALIDSNDTMDRIHLQLYRSIEEAKERAESFYEDEMPVNWDQIEPGRETFEHSAGCLEVREMFLSDD